MINIERIEPFLTFQVTVENKENNTFRCFEYQITII